MWESSNAWTSFCWQRAWHRLWSNCLFPPLSKLPSSRYGAATVSRIDQIIGLFCRYGLFYRALLQKSPIIVSILLTKATQYCLSRRLEQESRVTRMSALTAATHCNTLQHTATHCNTLQHTDIKKIVWRSWAIMIWFTACAAGRMDVHRRWWWLLLLL